MYMMDILGSRMQRQLAGFLDSVATTTNDVLFLKRLPFARYNSALSIYHKQYLLNLGLGYYHANLIINAQI